MSSYNYDVLKERNKREKFALDLCDMLIEKYFDKTEKPIVYIEDDKEYHFILRSDCSSLFNSGSNNVNIYIPTNLIEIKVINSELADEVNKEKSSIKYKFISQNDFNDWRDKYNFNLEKLTYSTGEILYTGEDCNPEQLEKCMTYLSMQIDQMHNLIDTAVKAFKKYYKDMQIKTISFNEITTKG